jgi:hypothetical protein
MVILSIDLGNHLKQPLIPGLCNLRGLIFLRADGLVICAVYVPVQPAMVYCAVHRDAAGVFHTRHAGCPLPSTLHMVCGSAVHKRFPITLSAGPTPLRHTHAGQILAGAHWC